MWRFLLLFSLLGLYASAQTNAELLAQHLKNVERIQAQKIERLAKQARYAKTKLHPTQYRTLIKTAKSYLGVKYVYGGNTKKGIDCSAFVQKVYQKYGKSLPRTSAEQYKHGLNVKMKELKPGDLVFFSDSNRDIGHVGIFLGKNKFIHASSGAKKVTITSLSKTYYQRNFKGARRF